MNIAMRAVRKIRDHFDNVRVRFSFRHIHGPKRLKLADYEVVLVLVGRNNAEFLYYNLEYHFGMGVSHVIYVDNGSTDESIAIVKSFSNTSIFSTDVNFKTHQRRIRQFAVSQVNDNAWALAIDCDELFDFLGSDKINLPTLARKLNTRGITGVVAQMLDMVPASSLSEVENLSFEASTHSFKRYTLKGIRKEDYHDRDGKLSYFSEKNRLTDEGVKFLYGGLRRQVFGEDCCLTKHALFKKSSTVKPFAHPHISTGLIVADFTALLRHYKFACRVVARERRLVEEDRMANGEINRRVQAFDQFDDFKLSSFTDAVDPSIEKLIEDGFLFASSNARQMFTS